MMRRRDVVFTEYLLLLPLFSLYLLGITPPPFSYIPRQIHLRTAAMHSTARCYGYSMMDTNNFKTQKMRRKKKFFFTERDWRGE